MFIDEFVWLPNIIEKLEIKHHVSQDEVEEVFFNVPRYRFVESGHRPDGMYTRRVERLQRTLSDGVLHPQNREYGANTDRTRHG
jgi:protein-L-isoaspartate O-methyltransferase